MTGQAPHDGSKVEVGRGNPGYRGPLPSKEVRARKVLLCKVLNVFGGMSQLQVGQVLNLDPSTVNAYVKETLPPITEDTCDEAPSLTADDLAELAGKLTTTEVAELRRDYSPGILHDGRDLGSDPMVRNWIDALN